MKGLLTAGFAGLLLLLSSSSGAVQPDEKLSDPHLEERARGISRELRCLVCQNESIDESNAGLARDLRLLVRERLTAGDDDRQVLEFIHDRYGDFVLLRPPLKPETWPLWFGPAAVLLLAAGALLWNRRSSATGRQAVTAQTDSLSAEDEVRVQRLLSAMEEPSPPAGLDSNRRSEL
jgi:cytochrome c-type biogenesis protein CcmH